MGMAVQIGRPCCPKLKVSHLDEHSSDGDEQQNDVMEGEPAGPEISTDVGDEVPGRVERHFLRWENGTREASGILFSSTLVPGTYNKTKNKNKTLLFWGLNLDLGSTAPNLKYMKMKSFSTFPER